MLVHGIDTNANQVPLLLGANGQVLLYGVDSGATPRLVRTDADGRIAVAGLVSGGDEIALQLDDAGKVVIAASDSGGAPDPLKTNGAGSLGVAGLDADGNLKAFQLDNDGHTQADIVTVPTLTVQSLGADKLVAYGESYSEMVSNLNATTSPTWLQCTPIAAGKIFICQVVAAFCTQRALTRINIQIAGMAGGISLVDGPGLGAGISTCWRGEILVPAGSMAEAYFVGMSSGDDIYVKCAGYLMDTP